MRKIHSLDFVLLETSLFGVNPGYSGRYIGPIIARIFGIMNLSLNLTSMILMISRGYFHRPGDLAINYLARLVYYAIVMGRVITWQIRCVVKNSEIARVVKEVSPLYLSTIVPIRESFSLNIRIWYVAARCLYHMVLSVISKELYQWPKKNPPD